MSFPVLLVREDNAYTGRLDGVQLEIVGARAEGTDLDPAKPGLGFEAIQVNFVFASNSARGLYEVSTGDGFDWISGALQGREAALFYWRRV